MDGNDQHLLSDKRNYPLLFEMMRSFAMLADTLNLSHTVQKLGSTRQTVRRHISQLEEALGGPLFEVTDRRYELTELGISVLPDALDILARARSWVSGQISAQNGLPYIRAQTQGWEFHQQRHPVGHVWRSKEPLLANAMRAWTESEGMIDHEAFASVRDYSITYRHSDLGWLVVDFGEQSFYVNWFGAAYARSSIGRPVGKLPGGEDFARMIDEAFREVQLMQTARLDHVYTLVPKAAGGELCPVAYQRLMLYGRFPDDSPAVMSFVVPTRDVDIDQLDPSVLETVETDI